MLRAGGERSAGAGGLAGAGARAKAERAPDVGKTAAGESAGSGPPRPALEPVSCWTRSVEASPRGARETSNVVALKADPKVRSIGEPTGSRAWAKMAARISHSAASGVCCRFCCAACAVAVCRWCMLYM